MKNMIIVASFIMFYGYVILLSSVETDKTDQKIGCDAENDVYGRINNIVPVILLLGILRYGTKFVLHFLGRMDIDRNKYMLLTDDILMFMSLSITIFVYIKALTGNDYFSVLMSLMITLVVSLIVNKDNIGKMNVDEAQSSVDLCNLISTKQLNAENSDKYKLVFDITDGTTQCYGVLRDNVLYVVFDTEKSIGKYYGKYYSLPLKNFDEKSNDKKSDSVNEIKKFHQMRIDKVPFDIYRKIRHIIAKKVIDAADGQSINKIIFTGFRYGGSIAQIASFDSIYENRKIFTYSFGSPYIGNNELVKYQLKSSPHSYNIVYSTDNIGNRFNEVNDISKSVVLESKSDSHTLQAYNNSVQDLSSDKTISYIIFYSVLSCVFILLIVISNAMYKNNCSKKKSKENQSQLIAN